MIIMFNEIVQITQKVTDLCKLAFALCAKFFLLFLKVYWHRKLAESWYWCNCINLDSIEAVKIVGIDMYMHKKTYTKCLIYNDCIDVKVIFPGVCE